MKLTEKITSLLNESDKMEETKDQKLDRLKKEVGLIKHRDGVIRYKFKPKGHNTFYEIMVMDGYWSTDFIENKEFADLRELLQAVVKELR